MRATSVLSQGLLRRSWNKKKNGNFFVHWDDDVKVAPPKGFPAATEVTVYNPDHDAVEVPIARKTLPAHHRVQIDLIAEETSWQEWYDVVKDNVVQTFGSTSHFRLMLNLTVTDALSRKGSYALSFCSVCSVVCVSVVMLTLLSGFSVVGLRLAEDAYGPVDLEMRTGGFAARAVSLNYTRVAEVLETFPPAYHRHSFRVDFSGKVRRKASCTLPDNTVQSLWFHPSAGDTATDTTRVLCRDTCVDDYCAGNAEWAAMTVVNPSTDPAFTSDAGGHVRRMLTKLPFGSVVASQALVKAIKVSVGDELLINSIIDPDLRHIFYGITNHETANPNVLLSVRIGATIDEDDFPGRYNDHFVLFPPANFTALVVDAMAPSVPMSARVTARSAKPAEYATRVVFEMPAKERHQAYMQSDFTKIRSHIRDWGAPITEKIGANQITMNTPLLSFLYTMQFFTSFVGLTISIIILALAFISSILIYTLLAIGVETKTYELGIHRMIGFRRLHLALLVFTNTYFFTLPAWLFGLIAGQIGYWVVRGIVVSYAAVPLGPGVSGSAVSWATLAGLGVPFLAALLPIRSLISMALPSALNTSRGRGTGVVYRIQRGRSREADLLLLGIGFLGALSGFAMYSFFPTSLITMNYSLMFYILFLVLLGMLGGLVMLATNFERVMETAICFVFMFWEAPAVRSMVSKSLSAHRCRNQQTTVMYALSVGFLVFITVAFNIEVTTLKYSKARSRGSDVILNLNRSTRPQLDSTPAYAEVSTTVEGGTTYVYDSPPLHPENMLGMMSEGNGLYFADYVQLQHDMHLEFGEDVVRAMTYRTAAPSGGNLFPVRQVRMKTLGLKENYALSLNPVPPNFYDVVNSAFIKVNKYDADVGRYGLTGSLYAASPAERAIIATTTNRVFALTSFTDEFLFETHVSTALRDSAHSSALALTTAPAVSVQLRAGRAVAVMDSSAVFLMTKFPNNMGEVLLSLPSAARHTGVPYLSCNVLSINSVFLRMPSPGDYERVEAFLRHWLAARHIGYSIHDITSAVKDIRTVETIFTAFFVVTQVVIMLICFFSLMSSMTANVLDSSKEIGVLLCLGMSRVQVYRVYVWEAFLLVVSSGSLGLLVGMALAETMLLQSTLFTQLSLPFPFPYTQLCIIFLMGIGSALAASVSPVMYLLNLPSITHILRRVI